MTRFCKLLYSMVNAYTRGAVEVLYAGAVEVRSWCGRGAVEVRLWCGRGTLVVRSRYALGTVLVYTVEVRSWCASGSLRFVNFSTGDTVYINLYRYIDVLPVSIYRFWGIAYRFSYRSSANRYIVKIDVLLQH